MTGSVGGPLDTVIRRPVVAGAVAIALPVGLVVRLFVGHEIAQREPVVGRDEVDRRPWAARTVEVAGAGEPVAQVSKATHPAPEVADGIPVAVVPLGPLRPEPAHGVTLARGIPGFGNQLAGGQQRIGRDRREHGRIRIERSAARPAQRRGEVEAKAVDTELSRPVAQRIGHHPHDRQSSRVQRVPGAGDVVTGRQVISVRGQAAPAQIDGRIDAALAGVVVDHVEDHLDTGAVIGVHQVGEFGDLLAGFGGVSRVRGEERQRRVAPIVGTPRGHQTGLVGMGVDRQQFQGGHVERLQVVDDDRVGGAEVRTAKRGRNAGMPLGQPTNVGFVDHRVGPGDLGARRRRVDRLRDQTERDMPQGLQAELRGRHQVIERGVDPARVGVEQQLGLVPVEGPVAVALPGLDSRDEGVPEPVVPFLHRHPELLSAGRVDQAQFQAVGVRVYREVGATRRQGGTQWERETAESACSRRRREGDLFPRRGGERRRSIVAGISCGGGGRHQDRPCRQRVRPGGVSTVRLGTHWLIILAAAVAAEGPPSAGPTAGSPAPASAK